MLCSLHGEKLKLFCVEDKLPICLVCQTSRKHKHHDCCPIEEVAQDHKEEVQTALESLQDKLQLYQQKQVAGDETAEYIKVQAQHTEEQIRDQFKKLHQFLLEEEGARLAALKEEEKQKSQTMKEQIDGLSREIATLSESIRAIEEELRADDISFLQNYKVTVERAQCKLPDPQLESGALIDVAKHLGNLTYRVWEKMMERIRFTPIILDPNTAASSLSLSDDLTSVRRTDTCQKLPDIPERSTYYAIVLGSEGFSLGQHSWEVEVGDHPNWKIGVINESADRKNVIDSEPENRNWKVSLFSVNYYDVEGETFTVKRSLQRIRVQLDYDRGELSFYDPEDMSLLCTHRDTFTETIYPCFYIGDSEDAQHPDIKISQSEVSVSVS